MIIQLPEEPTKRFRWVPPPSYPEGSVTYRKGPYFGPLAVLPAGFFPQPLVGGIGHYAVVEETPEPEPKPTPVRRPPSPELRGIHDELKVIRACAERKALAQTRLFAERRAGIYSSPPLGVNDLVTVRRGAELLGLKPKTVWHWIQLERLQCWGPPKQCRVSLAEVRRCVDGEECAGQCDVGEFLVKRFQGGGK
jgi:hypothetical protein